MKKVHDVIYVPGIGDHNPVFQQLAVNLWRFYGVRSWTVAMHWADQSEAWDEKLTRLLLAIDDRLSHGHTVSLVGVSAGASAALNAYAARASQISGVVIICGKINHPETIGPYYHRNTPAFVESVTKLQPALGRLITDERRHVLCLYSPFDKVVENRDSILAGAEIRRLRTPGHIFTNAFQLLFGAQAFLRFLKRQ
jgi:pimeloyl-ACP methyl ester carboxylesterase